MPDPKITITDLSVQFAERGSGGPLSALEHMNLTIGDGEFVCLVGPSGCGKTTLLRVLGGLQLPSDGAFTIRRDQSEVNRPLTAMVFQGVAVFPWLTVSENVAYGLRAQGVPYAERNRIAREWIGRVGLERFAEAYPYELSGGMQQRVGLARAFAYNPEVLLMDEPFGALDEQTRLLLQETLLDLWQSRRMTILFVTHSVDEALTLADKVVVLSARPARVLSEEVVTLPRPRDVLALRADPRFGELFGRVWGLLRTEVRTVESIR
ncbi:MAG: ABC transporter ATP-binding protein [Aggregatilineales bacterium]